MDIEKSQTYQYHTVTISAELYEKVFTLIPKLTFVLEESGGGET